MKASILSLATAVPAFSFTQEEITNTLIDMLSVDDQNTKMIQKLHQNSEIYRRHSVISDFKKTRSEWDFWGKDFPKKIPGMSQRNALYEIEAPKLACEAVKKALENWGGDLQDITHIIAISCTGLIAPGIEFMIMREFNLNPSVQRLGINFMGCFGAFKGLSVANSFAKENPNHRILVVCVELCTLHFQVEQTHDNMLANSLFSDGAAAMIIGANPKAHEKSLWEIGNKSSYALDNSMDKMKWDAGDHGFNIKLSHTVPVFIKKHIASFVQNLLGDSYNSHEYDWAIHPGGKSIIQAVEKALKLEEGSSKASWDTLADFGNMSSATFVFVLQKMLEQDDKKKWTVGLAFGPGLSVEGILLKGSNI